MLPRLCRFSIGLTGRSIVLNRSTSVFPKHFHSNPVVLSFTSSSGFEYVESYKSLNDKIEAVFGQKDVSDDDIIAALVACRNLERNYPVNQQLHTNSRLIQEASHSIELIFKNDTKFSAELLKKIFLLKLATPLNLKIINTFYEKNPGANTIIDKSTALVALRNALANADFLNAIKLTDVTVGHPNYIEHNNRILRKGFSQLVGTSLVITFLTKYGVNEIIDMGALNEGWKHLGAINSLILTYLFNSSFFLTIVRVGRQLISSGGDYLTWQKGTFYTHWFKHADEMLFSAKIVEADRQLNGGESNPEIINELCRTSDDMFNTQRTLQPGYNREGEKIRLLEAKDNMEDLKMQAYWMSGGDGFEWVEPDQDPADLIWKQHLDSFNKPTLDNNSKAKNLKWAEELIGDK
ncbi:predicted protein [Scheffersomyces stipitis CBS 6054]|uniref:Uncharacterized protein n=1 Tax=Scheffersomyces stipitis (strain ATCC 58785 / CBS 6054 / NBRC 10063 / NRRL Y-11545) TaxID=322104 RepID=A3LN79_PICST|nr:predicted protein [Scheffersomyces stipitis CBS 6054]ABN64810.1 predicted protein [Scheffersomyces stipitis CBS 6054]